MCVLLMRVNVKVLAKAFELIFATFKVLAKALELIFATFKVRGMTLLPSSVH